MLVALVMIGRSAGLIDLAQFDSEIWPAFWKSCFKKCLVSNALCGTRDVKGYSAHRWGQRTHQTFVPVYVHCTLSWCSTNLPTKPSLWNEEFLWEDISNERFSEESAVNDNYYSWFRIYITQRGLWKLVNILTIWNTKYAYLKLILRGDIACEHQKIVKEKKSSFITFLKSSGQSFIWKA